MASDPAAAGQPDLDLIAKSMAHGVTNPDLLSEDFAAECIPHVDTCMRGGVIAQQARTRQEGGAAGQLRRPNKGTSPPCLPPVTPGQPLGGVAFPVAVAGTVGARVS